MRVFQRRHLRGLHRLGRAIMQESCLMPLKTRVLKRSIDSASGYRLCLGRRDANRTNRCTDEPRRLRAGRPHGMGDGEVREVGEGDAGPP